MIYLAQNAYISDKEDNHNKRSDGDAGPTQKGRAGAVLSRRCTSDESIARLIRGSITENQRLILFEIRNSPCLITPLLVRISSRFGIPLSTLKSSARALQEAGLVESGNFSAARLTGAGMLVLSILSVYGDCYG